ncbi:signal recognition particle-docking protein FtsY, partial [Vibrio splendidus]
MTEKKKRGLLSWLGFGDEEQSPKTQNEANVENVEDQTEVESQVEAEAEVAKSAEPHSVESELAESDQALEETQEEQQPVLAEAEAEAEAEA